MRINMMMLLLIVNFSNFILAIYIFQKGIFKVGGVLREKPFPYNAIVYQQNKEKNILAYLFLRSICFNIIIQQQRQMNFCLQIINNDSSSIYNQQKDSQNLTKLKKTSNFPEEDIFRKKNAKQRWKTRKILYNWNKGEDRKYISFLMRNKQLFNLSKEERKCEKINVMMSDRIKTRSPAQCHTHHQKLMIKFGTIDIIIAKYRQLMSTGHSSKNISQSSYQKSNSNQSCMDQQKKVDEISYKSNKQKEPLWLPYEGIYSHWDSSYFREGSYEI